MNLNTQMTAKGTYSFSYTHSSIDLLYFGMLSERFDEYRLGLVNLVKIHGETMTNVLAFYSDTKIVHIRFKKMVHIKDKIKKIRMLFLPSADSKAVSRRPRKHFLAPPPPPPDIIESQL
jgi:hypothetical protein